MKENYNIWFVKKTFGTFLNRSYIYRIIDRIINKVIFYLIIILWRQIALFFNRGGNVIVKNRVFNGEIRKRNIDNGIYIELKLRKTRGNARFGGSINFDTN